MIKLQHISVFVNGVTVKNISGKSFINKGFIQTSETSYYPLKMKAFDFRFKIVFLQEYIKP